VGKRGLDERVSEGRDIGGFEREACGSWMATSVDEEVLVGTDEIDDVDAGNRTG